MTTPTLPALAINDLPLTLAMSGTSIAYPRFLKLLNDSIAAGAVAKVTHMELKQHFGRTLESLWEKHVSAHYFYGQGIQGTTPQDLLDFYYGDNTALHRVEATLRRVNACGVQHPAVDAMRQVLTEFVPIAQRLAALKECIVKRHVKSQEERNAEQRFVPTPATPAATMHVWDVLMKVTARNERQVVECIAADCAKRIDIFMSASPTMREKLVRNYENRMAVQASVVPNRSPQGEYFLKSDFKAELVALARKDVTELRDSFIFKVVSKIAPIVEAKGNLASVTEVSNTIHVGRLSGTLVVEFADGSRFLVDNNVVYSSSVRNKAFVRFPLTFHNVILADGSRMKQPSEERMHSIFCAAGELAQVALADEAECEGEEIGSRPGC
ncbi:MAG: hypothetical protein K2X55_24855 [Burkholderiaceae bacterium]|nr:hypothetical protein [Burkholderiaceae bacterium]